MEKKTKQNVPGVDLSWMKTKSLVSSLKSFTPECIPEIENPQTKTIVKMGRDISEIKKSTKHSFWKSLTAALIAGLIVLCASIIIT